MSKHVEILDSLKDLTEDALISLVGELLTTAEDVAFAYDITEEMSERISEVLKDYEIRHNIVEEDI